MKTLAARLDPSGQRAWGLRARRLLDRLIAQRADGLILGDDFPPPPDDFVGVPGDVPAPTRLCHIVASLLWTRYEAIRAFQDEMQSAISPDLSYHFAIAVSGLHFVLGIAERAASTSVRDIAEILNRIESVAAGYRHERVAALEVAGLHGGETSHAQDTTLVDEDAVRSAWRELADPAFRARLAAVAASV
jgi:hypothetical protein